jgi:hypothetical protein
MKLFKLLVASVAVLSSDAKADLRVHTDFITHHDEGDDFVGFRVSQRNRSDLIREAAKHSAAAYNDRGLVALKSSPLRNQHGFEDREALTAAGYQVISFSASIPGRGNVPAGIVTYKEDPLGKARITISFHGSESIEDFTEANIRAFKKQNPTLGISGYIHGGFHDRYLQSREALFDVVETVLNANNKTVEDVDFMVTGHSLGGALATLAAADVKTNLKAKAEPQVALVTFSSPRVFDHRGAEQMENLLGQNMIRVWRSNDPVPMVSMGSQILGWFTGFKHVGQSVKLESKTTGIFPSLTNHSLDTIKADALSDEEVRFDSKHVGVRTWLGNKASSIASSVSSGFRRLGSLFGF